MAITFQVLPRSTPCPISSQGIAYLHPDNWDDYSFKTLFNLTVFDEQGNMKRVGDVKIGFVGQSEGRTEEHIPRQFETLSEKFYSLGQDADYYRNLTDINNISAEISTDILIALGDVIHAPHRLDAVESEVAFRTSLMRSVNRSTIDQQFKRILRGEAPLTNYNFYYKKASNDHYSGTEVSFCVEPNSTPPSNIHILIGRNGVGKTTLLNNMVNALLPERGTEEETGRFSNYHSSFDYLGIGGNLPDDYFAGVVSVSFSAFDPFNPPEDQLDINAGMRYYYVGLKKRVQIEGDNPWGLKDKGELSQDIINSLNLCFALTAKKNRWTQAVKKLESDMNFADMDLCRLGDLYDSDTSDGKVIFSNRVELLFDRMSSGHAIVLLTITKLVETVEEKTLVLLDEPESHLHPPLLSAFTRALSDLLVDRNAVAIIATHSPVVLQEVPKSCVSILRRTRLVSNVDSPEIETFAENVGVLTREVFGLEVSKSGYHHLLASAVAKGKSYDEIELEYRHQLGFEGKAILRVMVSSRDLRGRIAE